MGMSAAMSHIVRTQHQTDYGVPPAWAEDASFCSLSWRWQVHDEFAIAGERFVLLRYEFLRMATSNGSHQACVCFPLAAMLACVVSRIVSVLKLCRAELCR